MGLFDALNVTPYQDPADIRHTEVLQRLLDGFRRDLDRYENEIRRHEERIESLRAALEETRDSTIPRYERRLEEMLNERDYGLRSDSRPIDTKSEAPGAHHTYR